MTQWTMMTSATRVNKEIEPFPLFRKDLSACLIIFIKLEYFKRKKKTPKRDQFFLGDLLRRPSLPDHCRQIG